MSDTLSDDEIKLLREINGDIPCRPWGAAISATMEYLHRAGYLTREFGGQLTEKGRTELAKLQQDNANG